MNKLSDAVVFQICDIIFQSVVISPMFSCSFLAVLKDSRNPF